MIAHGKTARRYGLVLELGGKDLKDYYYERDPQDGERLPRSNEPVLIEIIKGAARALAQFHKCDYITLFYLNKYYKIQLEAMVILATIIFLFLVIKLQMMV
uniref:Uncharacterized protein n=1 Tax=Meloidogyne enterolobii TaxID=390850 RepID=A0A6V7VC37_MELEN|nr:unnamed protein product [Meloidogyne enterolobii]